MRRKTMSRFDTDIPEEQVVGHCDCCGREFYAGYSVVKFEGEMFCEMSCFTRYLDVRVEPVYG